METLTKGNGLMTSQVGKENSIRPMVIAMKVLGKMVWLMVMEHIRQLMDKFTLVNGRMISKMEMVRKSGKMAHITKEHLKRA